MLIRAFIFMLSLSVCSSYANKDDKSCDGSLTLNGKPVQASGKNKIKNKKKDKSKSEAEKTKQIAAPQYSQNDREKLLVLLKGLLALPDDPRAIFLRDKLSSTYVIKLKEGVGSYWTLSFLLGNSGVEYNEKEIKGIEELTRKIVDRGWLVIHDADSAAAPIISRAAGKHSVAVGTSATSEKLRGELNNFVMINDPYLRLKTFGRMDRRSFSADSISGMAVFLNGEHSMHVPFLRSEFKDLTSAWAPESGEPSLGYKTPMTPAKIFLGNNTKKADPKKINFEEILNSFETKDLAKTFNFINELTIGSKAIDEHTKGVSGALVVGSSQPPGYYSEELYRIIKSFATFGMAITTGGSGGVMAIANAAAYDAGAISIGVPIVGPAMLAGETEISSEDHTLTVATSGYTSRLPLLIRGKKLIFIAPGGTGTMKEIAVLLMKQSVNPDPELVWMFIGRKYYGNLVAGLKKYLPESITNSMFVVDKTEEATEVFNGLQSTIWKNLDYDKLRTTEAVTPRNDRTKYQPPKPLIPTDSSSSSFWGYDEY